MWVSEEHSRWTEQTHRPETQAGGAGSSNNKVVVGVVYPGTRVHCGGLTIAHSGMGCDLISVNAF